MQQLRPLGPLLEKPSLRGGNSWACTQKLEMVGHSRYVSYRTDCLSGQLAHPRMHVNEPFRVRYVSMTRS